MCIGDIKHRNCELFYKEVIQPHQHHSTLQSGGAGSSSNSNKEPSLKETKAEEDKKSAGKESKGANGKGGWFSSLLGWKSSTPQAVLPDDKNPKVSLRPRLLLSLEGGIIPFD